MPHAARSCPPASHRKPSRPPEPSATRRTFLKLGAAAAAFVALSSRFHRSAWAGAPVGKRVAPADPVYHLLNRISYGVTPAELALAQKMGLNAYLEQQLNPGSIRETALKGRINKLKVWNLSYAQLYQRGDWESSYRGLIEGAVARAVYAKAQLYERVCEFWTDHFNVSGDDFPADTVDYVNALRRHAFGRFRDLLGASAKHPAMLFYLDNASNIAAHPNENYARELMELHTLGVDGGYTEQDVKEVARAFTGWSVDWGRGFGFYEWDHDFGAKQILGAAFPAGRGIEEGEQVLDLLANHPSTRRFVCRKLCRRFVSDAPPESLVTRMSDVWAATGGQIVPVLRELFLSAEFGASAGQKLRRPFDWYAAALRTTGAEVKEFWWQHYMLAQLAQVPHGWHPPNGYPDVARAWANTGGLLARWNEAFVLTDGALTWRDRNLISGLKKKAGRFKTAGQMVERLGQAIFGSTLSPEQAAPYVAFASDGVGAEALLDKDAVASKLGTTAGLMLCSPLFMWR